MTGTTRVSQITEWLYELRFAIHLTISRVICVHKIKKNRSALQRKKKYQIEQFYTTLLSSAERIILLSNRLTNTDRLIGVLNRCFYSILSGDMCDKHL